MKVLITGGAGFIGSHLADAYLARGDQVVVVDDLSSGCKLNLTDALNRGVKLYELPIQSKDLWDVIKREKPDLISHHAAQKSVRDSVDRPMVDADINIMGLLNVLEAARFAGVKKIIFASSGGVIYGEQESFPAAETHSKRPISPYGVSKMASELYLDFYCCQWGFESVALRYANVYGPRQDPLGEAGVVAIFCKRMARNEETIIFGSGKQSRDFAYIADIVDANLRADKTFKGLNLGKFLACNVGTSIETSIVELHEKLTKISGYQKSIKFELEKQGEQLRSSLSYKTLEQYTGWKPKHSLEVGLNATYDWFSKQSRTL